MNEKLKIISTELRCHSPFTLFGAFTGIVCMFLFRNLEHDTSRVIFYILHPGHVLLSAIVIASMYQLHAGRRNLITIVLIGFFGSIIIGTLSDSLIPYVGEVVLGMPIQAHEHGSFAEEAHIGFIEGWYIVIPAAIVGVVIALIKPRTKFPHAGHILLSTWASSFHMLMAMGGQITILNALGSFGFLFLAVLLPCCFGDIVFPLLFVKSGGDACHCCHHH